MGADQRRWDQLFAQLQAQMAQANQPSPYEQALAKDWQTGRDWLSKKDYRNLPDGVNVDLLPLSDYKRMQSYGQPGGGTVAQGGVNQMAMRNMQDLSNNELTRDWGQAYEQKVGGIMDRNSDLAAALQGNYSNRQNNAVQGSLGLLNAWGSRPKSGPGFWSQFAKGVIGGASQFAGAMI